MLNGAATLDRLGPVAERRRFSVDELLRMIADGIFGEDERIELVQGEILTVNPQGPDHRSLKDDIHARLVLAYAGRDVHVLNQGPVRVGPHGLREPDLAIVRGVARQYLGHSASPVGASSGGTKSDTALISPGRNQSRI